VAHSQETGISSKPFQNCVEIQIMEFKSNPEDFGLDPEDAERIYHYYIVEGLGAEQSIRGLVRENGHRPSLDRVRKWICTRGPSFYGKKSPFQGKNNAQFAEWKANAIAREKEASQQGGSGQSGLS
jgi:hypothetical protein